MSPVAPVRIRLPGFKPSLPVEIDWDHWMVRDSFFRLWMLEGAGPITTDFVGGLACDLEGGTVWDGDGIKTPGSSGNGEGILSQRTPSGFPSGAGSPMSVVTGQKIFSSGHSGDPRIVATGQERVAKGFYMFLNTTQPGNQYYLRAGYQGAYIIFNSGGLNDGQYHTTAIVYRGGTAANTDGYLDGRKLSTVASSGTTNTPDITPSKVAIGRHVELHTNDNELKATFKFAYLFGRALSDDEVAYISNNPFAPIRFRRFLIQIPAGSGGPIVQPVGQATESDTAFAVSGLKRASVGQAAETDTAFAASASKQSAVGQTTETDTAHPASILRTIHPSQATESDTAHPLTGGRIQTVGQTLETDASHPATGLRAHSVSQSLETDIGQSLTVLKRLILSQATEADTAPPVTVLGQNIVAVGLAVETDSATATGKAKTQGVSLVLESDTSWSVVPLRAHVVAEAGEADTAHPASVLRAVHTGQAIESDIAYAVTVAGQKLIPVGLATETEIAQALSSAKMAQVGLAVESDIGFSVAALTSVPLGLAAEIDSATTVGLARAVNLGLATEVDASLSIVIPGLTIGTKMLFTVKSKEIKFTVLG